IGGSDMPAKGDLPALPEGARWALDVVGAPDHLRPAVVRLLQDVVFAPDLATARTVISYAPELRTVTPEGDLLGAYVAVGGWAKQPSCIEVQAAVEEARQQRNAAEQRVAELREQLESVKQQHAAAQEEVARAEAARRDAEGARNAAGRRLHELGAAARSAQAGAAPRVHPRCQAEQASRGELAALGPRAARIGQAR